MPVTIRDAVTDAQSIIGEVAGPGVQMYSDDRMFADAIRAFNLLWKKRYWPHYCKWMDMTVDGVTGKFTTNDMQNILDMEDIIQITPDKADVGLPRLPNRINPKRLTGTKALYWTFLSVDDVDFVNKKVKIYPATATDLLNVHARFYPVLDEAWDWSDTFFLDRDMVTWGVAYFSLAGDQLNPGAADVCKEFMEMKYKDINAALGGQAAYSSSSSHTSSFLTGDYFEVR